MKLFTILFAGTVLFAGEGEPTDYKTAWERAQSGDKPLLVLVTAEWCAPCKTMKASTIPELKSRNAFEDCHYATVDLSKDETLGRKLIGKRGVPQFILFEKNDQRWERRYLRGIQSADSVEAFIENRVPARTAANTRFGR